MLPKSSQTEPNMVILALSWPILGPTCCQLGPSWLHLGPIFAPTSPKISTKSRQESQEAPPDTPRPPRGSPKGSRTALGLKCSWFWGRFWTYFFRFFLQSLLLFFMASLPEVRHGGGLSRAAQWIVYLCVHVCVYKKYIYIYIYMHM